ncbi:winged helix-turn-helix domain-containing protein [Brenneria tiliae]|uniref:winged helix-turn-helix domain-containing protein n=1 Tax=Brenneria tiliae TaxID=2914984 RepID=UPI00201488FB|nr:winged helix-turn-helix domain-containing protein [Brenneria tiliae]MCL2896116.1 winged helix-turn-helix domain-containing protein [Brenneria tiliae]MCL2900689.1 winged helix-turn-helix domain-containing protein [Brenneria tiliae]
MSQPVISLSAARNLHLAAQRLQHPLKRKPVRDDLLAAIRNMALLQIDTISVVARSPYLVLFSRLGHYPTPWLEEMLAEGKLFEYWAHEACFIPIEDYPLLRHRMLRPEKMGWKYSPEWLAAHQQDITALLSHIAENGPVRSADFSTDRPSSSGWWDWKPHKRHLEMLFTAGKLMVAERRNFHRVYDLAERVLPGWDDVTQALSQDQAEIEMLRRSAECLGLFKAEWLADYYRLKRIKTDEVISRLLHGGELTAVNVDGLEGQYYVHRSQFELLQQALQGRISSRVTTLLSPFDPVVWDRKRALTLFGFDYRLECYTPQALRRYGYFTLPILNRGELIGRVDAKIHRREKTFEIKTLHLEEGIKLTERRIKDLTGAFSRCARWHGAESVAIRHIPAELRSSWGNGWSLLDRFV